MKRLLVVVATLLALVVTIAACQAAPTATSTPQPTATKGPAAPAPAAAAATPTTAPTKAPEQAATKAPAPPTPSPVAKAKSEGKIIIALPEEPSSLEHFFADAASGYPAIRNMQEALLNRDPKTNELIGELATKWEQVKPDTWRFTLRKDVKFHNGEPVEAEGVVFGINRSFSTEMKSRMLSYMGPQITSKAVDPLTVDVTTAAPDPILPGRLYFAPLPAPKHAKDSPEQLATASIGTGPYKLVEWNRGQYIKMTANDDYWGGAPKIKDVVMAFRKESTVRAAMVRTGEADMARWINPEDCRTTPTCLDSPGVETMYIRLDVSPLAKGAPTLMTDKRVRQAMSFAVDRKSLTTTILAGAAQPASQLVGPFVDGHNPTLQPRPFDPDKAKKLLAEAKADGKDVNAPLRLILRTAYIPRGNELVEAVSGMLAAVGFKTKIVIMENATWQEALRIKPAPGDQLYLSLHGNELGDAALTVVKKYGCTSDTSTVCEKPVEDMNAKAQELTGQARTKAYQDIMAFLYDEEYNVPLTWPSFYYGLASRLEWKPRLDGFILAKEMSLKK